MQNPKDSESIQCIIWRSDNRDLMLIFVPGERPTRRECRLVLVFALSPALRFCLIHA